MSKVFATNVEHQKGLLYDFVELTKLRLGALVVFSAVISLFVVSQGQAAFSTYILLGFGGFLVSGAANALNEVFEKDYDALMERTKNRPIAAGRMTPTEGLLYAGLMAFVGLILLAFINSMTAVWGAISLVSYAFLYTPLKRYSSIAVLVGAFPGAFPLLIGGVAFQGVLTLDAIYLFSMQFFWQFGHFWAIAWIGDADYKKAGFLLLPFDGSKTKKVGMISMISCIPMIGFSILPFWNHLNNMTALAVVILTGLFFFYRSFELYRDCNDKAARKLMYASFIYLPVVLIAYAINIF